MVKVSYNASRGNSKLTDFDGLKDYIVRNSVRNIPRTIKVKAEAGNENLSVF